MAVLGRLAGKVTGRVVESVQPDVILSHVDLDALLDRIDVNRVLDRIDVERLVDRIDVERLMDRVDVERLLERVDVERLVRRAGLPDVVVDSQTRLAGSVVDVFRRQLAGLDVVLDRGVTRLLRRERGSLPAAPRLLEEPQ